VKSGLTRLLRAQPRHSPSRVPNKRLQRTGPSNGIASTPRALHSIMRVHRAARGSLRPLKCDVMRRVLYAAPTFSSNLAA
jgi:hypothetical protein